MSDTVLLLQGPSGPIQAQGDANGNVKVTGGGGGTQYTSGQATPANPVGSALVFGSSGNWQVVDGTHGFPINVTAGSITANAGTNLNTSSLALESGGNLASTATNTSNIGASADAAVVGDNAGSLSAKLRGLTKILNDIWDSVNHRIKVDGSGVTQPVSGTVTANAGTNLNTSSLALESGGNLASTATNTSNSATVEGTTTDAAVVGDNNGTLSAKLRGLTKILNTVWDSVNNLLHMNIKQFGGNAVVTGTGAGGNGIPRVTVSNDSNMLATQSGTWTVQPGNTANTTAWLVQTVAGTSGGVTAAHTAITSSGTSATSTKSSAGMVYNLQVSNAASSACYLKLYNLSSAPTVGSATGLIKTIQVPANGTVICAWPEGLVFSTGIAWCVTGGISDTDSSNATASLSVDIDYK